MKRTFLLAVVLIALTGCAPAYGVLKTYTGQSPVVEVAPGIYACNRYQVDADLLKLGPNVAVINVAAELHDEPVDGLVLLKAGIREANDTANREALAGAVQMLRGLREKGYVVVVHCWFGENRTPWVIAHYLAEEHGTNWRDEFKGEQAVRHECYFKDWMF